MKVRTDPEYESDLEYESLYDEALEMSRTLRAIDRELRDAATCEGDYDGGYPPSQLLPNLCKIMYAHHPYWSSDRYVCPRRRAGNSQVSGR